MCLWPAASFSPRLIAKGGFQAKQMDIGDVVDYRDNLCQGSTGCRLFRCEQRELIIVPRKAQLGSPGTLHHVIAQRKCGMDISDKGANGNRT